jgi:hypothetical protein
VSLVEEICQELNCNSCSVLDRGRVPLLLANLLSLRLPEPCSACGEGCLVDVVVLERGP